MAKITLKPTENQNFILLGGEFAKTLDHAHAQEAEGNFEGASRHFSRLQVPQKQSGNNSYFYPPTC